MSLKTLTKIKSNMFICSQAQRIENVGETRLRRDQPETVHRVAKDLLANPRRPVAFSTLAERSRAIYGSVITASRTLSARAVQALRVGE